MTTEPETIDAPAPPAATAKPSARVAVVVTRYAEANDLVIPCLEGLAAQKKVRLDVHFLDQKQDPELRKLCKTLSTERVQFKYANIPAKSLSYARNHGIRKSKARYVLFIDCDAIPHPGWAHELLRPFTAQKRAAIVGGRSDPRWLRPPSWYHRSNLVQEVYSLLDLGPKTIKKNKIVGVSFGLDAQRLGDEAFFDEELGRRPGSLLGGEESDLCRRAIDRGYDVYYVGKSVVDHQIQTDRMSLRWVMRRFYFGGYGRGKMGAMPQANTSKRTLHDRLAMAIIIVPYGLGYVRGMLTRGK